MGVLAGGFSKPIHKGHPGRAETGTLAGDSQRAGWGGARQGRRSRREAEATSERLPLLCRVILLRCARARSFPQTNGQVWRETSSVQIMRASTLSEQPRAEPGSLSAAAWPLCGPLGRPRRSHGAGTGRHSYPAKIYGSNLSWHFSYEFTTGKGFSSLKVTSFQG